MEARSYFELNHWATSPIIDGVTAQYRNCHQPGDCTLEKWVTRTFIRKSVQRIGRGVSHVKRCTAGSLNLPKDIQTMETRWLWQQHFYAEGIAVLVHRWNKCLNVGNSFVENKVCCHVSIWNIFISAAIWILFINFTSQLNSISLDMLWVVNKMWYILFTCATRATNKVNLKQDKTEDIIGKKEPELKSYA